MVSLLTSFIVSFTTTYLIIRFQHLHGRFSTDFDLSGPQKFHTKLVPRIGGISIATALLTATIVNILRPTTSLAGEISFLVCAIPVFSVGLLEDTTKNISVRSRFTVAAISAALFAYLVQAQITRFDILHLDLIFNIPYFGIAMTIFAVTGLANAYNIIDGFNGLASMVGILTLLAIAYISLIMGDPLTLNLSLTMVAAILGFFVWNYPLGLIFLGDGGAYLIGFWIATLSILVTYRHQEISPWFAILINGYPIVETVFSIYRRKIHQGKSPGQPDGMHFHSLIFRRTQIVSKSNSNWLTANSKTAPYLWILSGLSIAPAVLWWNSTILLITSFILFFIFYIWMYGRIVKFRAPKWFRIY